MPVAGTLPLVVLVVLVVVPGFCSIPLPRQADFKISHSCEVKLISTILSIWYHVASIYTNCLASALLGQIKRSVLGKLLQPCSVEIHSLQIFCHIANNGKQWISFFQIQYTQSLVPVLAVVVVDPLYGDLKNLPVASIARYPGTDCRWPRSSCSR